MSAILHHQLAALVSSWRAGAWTHEYSALSEILRWAEAPEGSGFTLRPPQLRALETYWYLRLVKGTPRTLGLYRDLFPKTADLLRALGIADESFRECDFDLAALWERIRSDDDFIRRHRFESLRESLTLDYPSYILALAMGAGKTALIGAIIATEFALAQIKIPPLLVKRLVRRVVPREAAEPAITLRKPNARAETLKKVSFTVAAQATARSVLQQIGDTVEIATEPDSLDAYAVAVELAAIFRLDPGAVCGEIRRLYGAADVPEAHLPGLSRQIEEQTRNYEVREEAVETALALVKPDGFRRETTPEGVETYTAEISYPVDRERLLISLGSLPKGKGEDFGFHYEPYNFDSGPEVSFFQEMLTYLNLHPEQIEDIYFTGALTNPRQTDFFVDYKGEDNDWHRYTPDFVIRRKDGRCLIVEIKDARWEATTREDLRKAGVGEPALTVEGRKAIAVKKWEDLNPDRLKYELIFAREATIPYNDLKPARVFMEGTGTEPALKKSLPSPPLPKGDQGGFPPQTRKKTSRKGARS